MVYARHAHRCSGANGFASLISVLDGLSPTLQRYPASASHFDINGRPRGAVICPACTIGYVGCLVKKTLRPRQNERLSLSRGWVSRVTRLQRKNASLHYLVYVSCVIHWRSRTLRNTPSTVRIMNTTGINATVSKYCDSRSSPYTLNQ